TTLISPDQHHQRHKNLINKSSAFHVSLIVSLPDIPWSCCSRRTVPGGDTVSARRDISEPETIATLERCFRLLAGNKYYPGLKSAGNSGTLINRCLKRPVFDRIKHRVTRMDHNLFDVIWPALKKHGTSNGSSIVSTSYSTVSTGSEDNDAVSVVAPDFESYTVFMEFFDPLIRDIHCVTASGELPDHPSPRFFLPEDDDRIETIDNIDDATIAAIETYDLDVQAKYIQAATIECCRNLEKYPFPLTLTVNQLEDVERVITSELMSPDISGIMAEGSSEDEPGTYFTLNEILDQPSPIRAQLAAAGLLLPITDFNLHDEKRLHGRHWPYGRGVYVASAGDLAAWVNVQDHLRIICRTGDNRPGLIGRAYARLAKIMVILEEALTFRTDRKLGFLSSRPYAVGNTLRFTMIIRFPELSKEYDNLKHLCVVRGLTVRETARHDTVKVTNQQSLSITEIQTLQDFSRAVSNILALEKEVAINNSMKIANLLAGIFRKRSSAKRFHN
ncbi:arginine kinase-like, partial [Lasioglossum baleicum]|uniref:arginine kinase-like n=1 Tax=Lasioglossum baleicum TaxID=434251 RepID=UPI003FCEABDF